MQDTPSRDTLSRLLQQGHLSQAEFDHLDRCLRCPAPRTRLQRSRKDRWLGGVCGGLAAFLGWEAWPLRLLAVLTLFWFGSGVLVYLLAWIFAPIESRDAASLPAAPGATGAGWH